MSIRPRTGPLLLFACVFAFAHAARAQINPGAPTRLLRIRMLDGRSGKPFPDKNVFVTFWWDDPSQPAGKRRVRVGFPNDDGGTDVALDDHGIGTLAIPPQATRVQVQFVENVIQYGKRGQYLLCNVKDNRYRSPEEILTGDGQLVPLDVIASHGFVPQTDCTPRLAVHPGPGEFVVLALPDHCWPLCGLVF